MAGKEISLWFEKALVSKGWENNVRIGIVGSRVTYVTLGAAEPGDERHGIALPGLCNLHSHGFQRAMAGLTEFRGEGGRRDDFWSWRALMYRFLDRLDPDDVEAITAQAYVEMLESGYTRTGEFHYLHNDPSGARYADPAEMAGRIVAAAEATGMGLTLLPVFYAHGDFGGAAPLPEQRRFLSSLDSFAYLHQRSASLLPDDAEIGIAPHSLRAVTPEELARLLLMAPEGPVHIHAAEQVAEVEASLAHFGIRPVEWLLDNAGVDRRWCLVHATHLTDAESDALAASGAVAGLCPITEANLGDGIFPAAQYLSAGGAIGTGTDSNILIDAMGEIRMIEYAQRLSWRARNILALPGASTGSRLFNAVLHGGAQALGVSNGIAAAGAGPGGSVGIAVGARADIVALNATHPSLLGRSEDALLDSLIFAARTSPVDAVWRAGKRVVTGGRHHASEMIGARFARTMGKLLGE